MYLYNAYEGVMTSVITFISNINQIVYSYLSCVCEESEHHCGARLVLGPAKAHPAQRGPNPECQQMPSSATSPWQAGQVSDTLSQS